MLLSCCQHRHSNRSQIYLQKVVHLPTAMLHPWMDLTLLTANILKLFYLTLWRSAGKLSMPAGTHISAWKPWRRLSLTAMLRRNGSTDFIFVSCGSIAAMIPIGPRRFLWLIEHFTSLLYVLTIFPGLAIGPIYLSNSCCFLGYQQAIQLTGCAQKLCTRSPHTQSLKGHLELPRNPTQSSTELEMASHNHIL